ncbi:MAG: hypothetical protein IPG76_03770 [Acidobacteria bacterium]|nr:hypothetical protein [Acidobacteriota bacterium]
MKKILVVAVMLIVSSIVTAIVTAGQKAQVITVPLDKIKDMKLINVTAETVIFKGRKAVRVIDAAAGSVGDEGRLAILPDTEFEDGVIEVDLSGEVGPNAPEGARGFVGLAFRTSTDASHFECFYLRPTNGRAQDQVRRNHSAQYISFPGFPWQRLRKEFPEKYESYVDLVPGEWTRVRIEISGVTASLFVHGSSQPALIVSDLKQGKTKGAVALWVGPGTVAHFSNLRVTGK